MRIREISLSQNLHHQFQLVAVGGSFIYYMKETINCIVYFRTINCRRSRTLSNIFLPTFPPKTPPRDRRLACLCVYQLRVAAKKKKSIERTDKKSVRETKFSSTRALWYPGLKMMPKAFATLLHRYPNRLSVYICMIPGDDGGLVVGSHIATECNKLQYQQPERIEKCSNVVGAA